MPRWYPNGIQERSRALLLVYVGVSCDAEGVFQYAPKCGRRCAETYPFLQVMYVECVHDLHVSLLFPLRTQLSCQRNNAVVSLAILAQEMVLAARAADIGKVTHL